MKAISADNFMLAMKCNYIMQVITIYCLLFVKVSICLFIARLGPRPIYKKICYGTATILTVYTIASGFTIIFQCIPIEKTWNRGGVQGTCFPSTTMVGLAYAHTGQSREYLFPFFLFRPRSGIDPLHSCKCLYGFFPRLPTGPNSMESPNPHPPESNPHYCVGTRFIVGYLPIRFYISILSSSY